MNKITRLKLVISPLKIRKSPMFLRKTSGYLNHLYEINGKISNFQGMQLKTILLKQKYVRKKGTCFPSDLFRNRGVTGFYTCPQ
jgi:hypothetical protein